MTRAYRLYEEAVQTPERDVEAIDRLFRARAGRGPLSLREDFCGTALLSARWVESDDDREAVAVDLDPRVLRYAQRAHLPALEDDAERVSLVCGDVRALSDRAFDVITAMNFSWAVLDDGALAEYLAGAARCLEDDGLLALEIFGGRDLTRVLTREHPHDDFTYIWEQRAYDAGLAILDARIHFRLGNGRTLRDAFAYRFHLRPVDAVIAALHRAGLKDATLLVEDRAGRYRRRATEPRASLWRGLIVAGPSLIPRPARHPALRRERPRSSD